MGCFLWLINGFTEFMRGLSRAVDIYSVNMFFVVFFSLEKEFGSAWVGPALIVHDQLPNSASCKKFIDCSGTIVFTPNTHVLLDQLHS